MRKLTILTSKALDSNVVQNIGETSELKLTHYPNEHTDYPN